MSDLLKNITAKVDAEDTTATNSGVRQWSRNNSGRDTYKPRLRMVAFIDK